MRSENLLIIADSDHDANMLYAVGMFVPDPFIYFRFGRKNYVVLSDLEIDRARKQAPHCKALSLSRYQEKLRQNGTKHPGIAEVARAILKEKGVRQVTVPHHFPLGLANQLQKAGVKLVVKPGNFFTEREFKSAAEVRKISAALMMAEAEKLLRQAGCPKINLQIRSTNLAVIDFYRNIGFKVDEVTSMGKRLETD